MIKAPYGQAFVLKTALENVECWNHGDCMATLPAGEVVELVCVNDATHTTIRLPNQEDGIPVAFKDGRPYTGIKHQHPRENREYVGGNGYRFIAENQALGAAIGVPMPKKTADLVGDIIAHESGQADEKTTKRLFKTLKKSGIGSKLQGRYSSRM